MGICWPYDRGSDGKDTLHNYIVTGTLFDSTFKILKLKH